MTEQPVSRAHQNLTGSQQEMVRVWEEHQKAEFVDHDIDVTMATMTEDPVNVAIPLGGGAGFEAVRGFYDTVLLRQVPEDMEFVLIARTVGTDRIVDEVVLRFTHSMQMDWLLPGVPPTNRWVEHPCVVIADFRDGKIAGERLYWDHASLLAQVGLLDTATVPTVGEDTVMGTLLQMTRGG